MTDIMLRTEPGEGLSALDKKLLSAASERLSPEEIAARVGMGITPAGAAQRIREILRSRDWLSILERKALVLDDLMSLRAYLNDMMEKDRDPGTMYDFKGREIPQQSDPRWAQNMLQLIKEISRVVEVDEKSISEGVQTIREGHAHLMIEAIDVAFTNLARAIHKEYPAVDRSDLYRFMESALPAAIELVESRTAQ